MSEVMKTFISLMHSAYSFARQAKNYSFDYPDENQSEDKVSAMAYASACIAKYSAAQALYASNLNELEHYEINELFGQFGIFCRELLDDFATNHSRQWVSIEFERLKDLFENSICNQSIID